MRHSDMSNCIYIHNITSLDFITIRVLPRIKSMKKLIKSKRTIEQYKEHILTSSLSCGFRDNS